MKKNNNEHRNLSTQEAVDFAMAQVKGLREGKPVLRPGWLYLDTLEEIERRNEIAEKSDPDSPSK